MNNPQFLSSSGLEALGVLPVGIETEAEHRLSLVEIIANNNIA